MHDSEPAPHRVAHGEMATLRLVLHPVRRHRPRDAGTHRMIGSS